MKYLVLIFAIMFVVAGCDDSSSSKNDDDTYQPEKDSDIITDEDIKITIDDEADNETTEIDDETDTDEIVDEEIDADITVDENSDIDETSDMETDEEIDSDITIDDETDIDTDDSNDDDIFISECSEGETKTESGTVSECENGQWKIKRITVQFGTAENERGGTIVTDKSGNIYVTGSTYGSFESFTNTGEYDLFITKFDSSKNILWTKQWGTSEIDYITTMEIDSLGNIYVAGYTEGSFEGFTNAGETDLFVTKISPTGEIRWTQSWGTSTVDFLTDMSIYTFTNDSGTTDYIYVTGYTKGEFPNCTNIGNRDIFVTKLFSTGEKIWTKQIGTSSMDEAETITTDSSGNIYIAGSTQDAFPNCTNAGSFDIFTMKLLKTGEIDWIKQWGSSENEGIYAITLDNSGNIYVTGHTYGNIAAEPNNESKDVFAQKLSETGEILNSVQFGTSEEDKPISIVLDSLGNIYIAGSTDGCFDGYIKTGKYSDLFLTKLSNNCELEKIIQWGCSQFSFPNSMTIDALDNIYITGLTLGDLDGNIGLGSADIFFSIIPKY